MIAKETKRRVLESALVAVAFAIYLYPAWSKAWIFTFQTRDILRAQELLRGHLIFFGPEVTGGGYLPGGLYYYLLAIPLAFGLGWKGTWLVILAHQSILAGLLWGFFRWLSRGVLVPLFSVLALATALPICLGSLVLLNSACVFLPAAAVLVGLAVAYTPSSSERARSAALALVFFAFATGMQMHLSVLYLLPPFLILQLLGGRGGFAHVPWPRFLRSLLFLFPLAPWLLWRVGRMAGISLGQQPPAFAELKGLGNFVTHSYGNFTLIYWQALRYYGSFWYAVGQILRQMHRYLTDVAVFTWPCYLALAFWIAGAIRRRVRCAPADPTGVVARIFFVAAACTFVPGFLTMGGGAMGVRYLAVSSLTWITFAAAVLEVVTRRARFALPERFATGPGRAVVVAGIGAASVVYLASFGVLSGRFPLLIEDDAVFVYIPPASELEAVSRYVAGQTGWSHATFRERAFLLNVFSEMTIQTNYEEVEGKRGWAPGDPDGFFIARRPTATDVAESEKDLKAWILAQRPPANVAEGLGNGGITLGSGAGFGSMIAVPYRVTMRDRYPPYFQNRSEHYQSFQEERIDEALREQGAAPDRTFVALFNHCPSQSPHCRLAMVARSADLRDPRAALTVDILGVPLSHPTQHYNPGWTEAILDSYLAYQCTGTEAVQREALAPGVGYYIVDRWLMNHAFLAPYRRELRLHCPEGARVRKLTLGFRQATSNSFMKDAAISGQERSFELPR